MTNFLRNSAGFIPPTKYEFPNLDSAAQLSRKTLLIYETEFIKSFQIPYYLPSINQIFLCLKKLDQKRDHSNFAEPRSILVAESLERFPFSPTDTFRKRDLLAAKNIDSNTLF